MLCKHDWVVRVGKSKWPAVREVDTVLAVLRAQPGCVTIFSFRLSGFCCSHTLFGNYKSAPDCYILIARNCSKLSRY